MENSENQNPYAALISPANQPEERVGRSNECLWLGVISAVGFVAAYLLFYWCESLSIGPSLAAASVTAMLLCFIAGAAGVAGFFVGVIEAIAQLTSSTVFGQKETVFIGLGLSLTGPAILGFKFIQWVM